MQVPIGSSFLAFSLADPLRAATCEVTFANDERGCHCSSLCSEHVDEICFEPRSLLGREFARGDGRYMRKSGRTSKATAIPTRFAHTQSVGSGDAHPVSAPQRRREEHEREKVSVCPVLATIKWCRAVCACVSSSLFWQKRKWCANDCVKYACVRTYL